MPDFDTSDKSIDDTIVNLLRCEPPSPAFNYFEYGGLTRSIFQLMSNIEDLEDIVRSRSESGNDHVVSENTGYDIFYSNSDSFISIVANPHNKINHHHDAKFFFRSNIRDNKGKEYNANFIAIEVYRDKEGNNPIWEFGLYFTEKKSNEIIYAEEAIVHKTPSIPRTLFLARIIHFNAKLSELNYCPLLYGIKQETSSLTYLNEHIFSKIC
jgi:hypothetical protein